MRKIDASGRSSIREKFITRTCELLLAEDIDNRGGDYYRLRADRSYIKEARKKAGWNKTTFDYHLKQGRQWKRICGDYEDLLCFLFLEDKRPFGISLDQYCSLKGDDLKTFYHLLRNDYVTAICAAGKALQNTLQSTTADVEFS